MYTVISIFKHGSGLRVECYGPFKTKREAQRQARAIEYPAAVLVEFLWGDVRTEAEGND
jgi:hypothetical protein